jgi:hypothetical protein
MKPVFPLLLTLALAPLTACAPAGEPLRVRAADLGRTPGAEMNGRPLIIEISEGDVLPVDFTFSSELVALEPASPPLAFKAKRHFFLRVGSDGVRASLDGVHFDKPRAPGSFRFGIGGTPQGARVEVNIKTPEHAPAGT